MGGNSRGLQPVPGITGISVESINRGSIRKATVTLKAYNKFQFGIIEILYLKLGYLMMLEWGWDKYIDSIDNNNNPVIKNVESTIIENQWFKDGSVSQLEMLRNINGFVDLYKGNYQGFFGKVNNFSWTLNADNTYDITVNLITLGSVIESINAIVPSSPLTTKQIKERTVALRKVYKIADEEGELLDDEEDNKVITNLGSDRISSFIAQQIATFFDQNLETNQNYYHFPNAVGKTNSSGENIDVETNQDKIPPSSRYYIRFKELLKNIEENVIFKVVGVFILGYLGYVLYYVSAAERKKLIVAIFITFFMTLFWGFHELSGSVITLFASRNVALDGIMSAAQTNALNSMFIIVLAIPISLLWGYLAKKGMNPRTPYKFGLGLLLLRHL